MGGRALPVFLIPYPKWGKAFQPSVETLTETSEKTASPLSNSDHTGPMKTMNLRLIALSFCALLLAIAWAIVIWIALSVSEIVLSSLDMIVELAGITP